MLRIKYLEEFKNDQPFIVILADTRTLKNAYDFFKNQQGAFLNDRAITEFSELSPLESSHLYLTSDECQGIAELFRAMAVDDKAGHVYFDTEALGDKAEIIISHMEYTDLF